MTAILLSSLCFMTGHPCLGGISLIYGVIRIIVGVLSAD